MQDISYRPAQGRKEARMRRTIDPKTADWREILAFSLLPLGILTIDCTVYTVMDFYLTDVLKLSMGLASFVLLGTKAWDAINDPLMGQLVERTRTKHGKCRPYRLWTPLPQRSTKPLPAWCSSPRLWISPS